VLLSIVDLGKRFCTHINCFDVLRFLLVGSSHCKCLALVRFLALVSCKPDCSLHILHFPQTVEVFFVQTFFFSSTKSLVTNPEKNSVLFITFRTVPLVFIFCTRDAVFLLSVSRCACYAPFWREIRNSRWLLLHKTLRATTSSHESFFAFSAEGFIFLSRTTSKYQSRNTSEWNARKFWRIANNSWAEYSPIWDRRQKKW